MLISTTIKQTLRISIISTKLSYLSYVKVKRNNGSKLSKCLFSVTNRYFSNSSKNDEKSKENSILSSFLPANTNLTTIGYVGGLL